MPFDTKELSRLPKSPGVYLMKDLHGKVLYIGKANNLQTRIKQYFSRADERAMIPYLLEQLESIDTLIVRTEKEALLLENNLIKQHQPKYNALLKDDKAYFSLMINHKHLWPMLRVVRYKGKPPPDATYFGPYTKGYAARVTLELLRRLFPLRQCSDRELASRTRPCILYDMKRCIAPCVNKCTKEEYDRLVKQLISFLKGHDKEVLHQLKEEMQQAASRLEFERAEGLYKTIQHIEATLEKQGVQKVGQKDLDIIGLARDEERSVITLLFFREGRLAGSIDHLFTKSAQDDDELLTSFILQNYADKESYPHEIVTPFPLAQQQMLSELFSEEIKRSIAIWTPKIGEKRELLLVAAKNAEARLKRAQDPREEKESPLILLEEELKLLNFPAVIECIDSSNISGSEPVAALVVFTDGRKSRARYRKYKLSEDAASDDYEALREVLRRRFGNLKESEPLPDLLIIDGAKGHLGVAHEILEELDITTVDLIALAKESAKHTRGLTLERIYLPHLEKPIILRRHSPALLFLQQVRDEAHRFAITFQKKRRSKRLFSSALKEIPGIGPIKQERLLRTFGSVKKIFEASEEELRAVPGINKRDIETLKKLSDQV